MYNIAVVGCGVIGITSALEIQKKLGKVANVTIFAKDFSPNTTSDIAAGLWEPYLLQDTPSEKVLKWSKKTYEYILRLWKEGCAKEAGISLQPVINLSDNKNYILPVWVKIAMGYSEIPQETLRKYSDIYNTTFCGGFCFTSFTWEGSIFLPFLQEQFIVNGGKIVNQEIRNLEQLSGYDVIVNCTGLGAIQLTRDDKVRPIRGQIIKVNAPWQYHSYIIDSHRTSYVIPNISTVILGGTKQSSFNLELSEKDSSNIIVNCKTIIPSLRYAEIVKHEVGLRPGRVAIRIEKEYIGSPKGLLKIVHNYGHGGSGITLCIGCAEEAAGLVEEIITDSNIKTKSKL